MHAYEVEEDDEVDEAEVGDEEDEPAEDALVGGDILSDDPSFAADADMRADDDGNVWPSLHSLPREPSFTAIRVPVGFAELEGDSGAAKLTCGKWRMQSASAHCGSFGPINWHHVACGDCFACVWPHITNTSNGDASVRKQKQYTIF